jgi:hypothetical protein
MTIHDFSYLFTSITFTHRLISGALVLTTLILVTYDWECKWQIVMGRSKCKENRPLEYQAHITNGTLIEASASK